MVPLKRRDFLKAAGIAGGVVVASKGGGLLGGIAIAAAPTYTGVTYLTPAYKDIMPAIAGCVEQLKKNAGSDFKVDFFDSQTLVKADEQIPALRAGTIQFMFHTSSYITRAFKIMGITGLPGIVEDLYRHPERLAMESPLWKAMNDVMAKDNIFQLSMGGGVLEPEYIWSGSQKVASLADLNGKRVRIVSYEATEALKNFGASATRIPSSELYLAVQRGTVDAVLATIGTIVGRRVHEQVKHVFKLPVTAFTISIYLLKDKWDQLPGKVKSAFWDAAKWFDKECGPRINSKFYPEVYWPMMKEAGIQSIEPKPEELKLFASKSEPIWKWWKDQVGEDVGQKMINLALGKA